MSESYSPTELVFRNELAQKIRDWRHADPQEVANAIMQWAGPSGKGFLKVPLPPRCREEEGNVGVRCELREIPTHTVHVGHYYIYNQVTEKEDLTAEVRWPIEAEVMKYNDE